ncbi:MAG: PHP domain-containing protein, partial [Armatimonadota bacterium]|nr:PHP domain-containing protein [Armatimonadota bacterium]
IALCEHVDFDPRDEAYGFYNPEGYFTALAAARAGFPGVEVLAGVEVGEPHAWPCEVQQLLSRFAYDVVLGSVHWVEGLPMGRQLFQRYPMEKAWRLYLAEVARVAEGADVDVVAHLDLVKRHGNGYYREAPRLEAFEPELRRIFAAMVARGLCLEVNTSGLRQEPGEPYPAGEVLALYREMGGRRVCLGSDAHRPKEVGAGFHTARQILRAAGFSALTFYRARQPVHTPL